MRSKYWPIQGRPVVKRVERYCIICKTIHGSNSEQLMADLPVARVEGNSYTLKYTGVDLSGPMATKAGYRGGQREKR